MTTKVLKDKLIITHDKNFKPWDGYCKLLPSDLKDIDNKFYSAQVKDIYAPTILNYIEQQNLSAILVNIINKLSVNGHITIGGIDPHLLSKQVLSRNINLIELNKLLFADDFKCLVSIAEIKELLGKLRIKILSMSIDSSECRFAIQGIKQ